MSFVLLLRLRIILGTYLHSSYFPLLSECSKLTTRFWNSPEDGSVPFNIVNPKAGETPRNFGDFDVQIRVHDIRGKESEYNLDKDAFTVVSGVPESAEKDFVDDDSIKKNYYPEVCFSEFIFP